ncbi:plasma serine protease inhibitor-like [Chelonus insularis]|uniref:plasma serine protease inhibitor-like n=1 Tax=Chelonus insularis TaxID=460826 RepID=UPI0015886FCD|nr:plasma serine protease inhibitor-like [Chelonus insularis]
MYIIVPDKYDLTYVEENFDKINFFELNASKQLSKVDLSLPKFKISNRSNLQKTLEKLDIKRIFTKEADFTGISKSSKLHVDKIVQKTELEIDEDGSEAGSATAIIDVTSSPPRKALRNVRFIVDRPFIVAITVDEFIIFVGRVVDPTK